MKDLLLEIGTEEIPARFLEPALAALLSNGRERFANAGLDFKGTQVYGTPRRLALFVEGLATKTLDQEHEFLGPALAQSKDAAGNWTPAAQGFARSQGTTAERLSTRDTDRGPRLVFLKKTVGAPTEKILPTVLPDLIRSLAFPKSMVWEESRLAFARPIRWIVALYGIKPIPFSLAGVKAGRRTLGLRFQSQRPFDIPAPNRYASLMKNHCVIVDPTERRDLIIKQIDHVAKTHHGHIPVEKYAELLEEVSNLVEHPVAVVGKFDPRFLAVPKEVLVTSMKKHQKYFPVFQDESCAELLPFFVAVRNGLSDNQSVVREGYERVLAARLSDAAFFFSEHAKRTLASRGTDLKGIAFLSPALSMKDKTERVRTLAGQWCVNTPAIQSDVLRIAELAKADLTTGLVGEFPELQGIVGRLYAERDGESPAVARGIEEHYWPLTAEGTLPIDESSAWVSLADKMDTLAGNFLIGKIPSGSQDPYGLRRAAVGILRLLESRGWALSLSDLVQRALGLLPADLGDRAKAGRTLMDFFQQRWAGLAETRGFRPDEVAAVAAVGFDDVGDAWARLSALRDARRHPDFAPLSIAFKRAANLLKQAEKRGDPPSRGGAAGVREDLFQSDAERVLRARVAELEAFASPLLLARDYASVLAALVSLRVPVDEFFVRVVVMDPDDAIRNNRLRLLAAVRALFVRVADFAQLQETPSSNG